MESIVKLAMISTTPEAKEFTKKFIEYTKQFIFTYNYYVVFC